MNINICETAQDLANLSVAGKAVVVIDVFRAASTMITALAHGARVIFPVSGEAEAYKLKNSHPKAILGGEHCGKKIPGFDLGNSPFEYREEVIRDRPLIFLSTNGTKALTAAMGAEKLYAASFLNSMALAQRLHNSSNDLLFACAGTKGSYSLEDACCAGYIIHLLQNMGKNSLNDSAIAALMLYKSFQDNLPKYLCRSSNGRSLALKGHLSEIRYCCTRNIYSLVPEFIDEKGVMHSI